MKKCTGPCGQLKPISEFTIDRKNKDGFSHQCKVCKRKGNQLSKRKRNQLNGHVRIIKTLEILGQPHTEKEARGLIQEIKRSLTNFQEN